MTKQNSTLPASTMTRDGFTMIEVMIAVVLLAGVVLAMGMSTTVLGRNMRSSDIRNRAQSVADMQIGRARAWPTYSTLSQLSAAKFNGSADGLTSATTVSVDSSAGKNLTTVTVTVTSVQSGALASPIVRSVSIAP